MTDKRISEVGLGADLYVKAIEHGLPHLFNHGAEFSSKKDFFAAKNAFNHAAKQLIALKVVTMDDKRNWTIDEAAISDLSQEEKDNFVPYYDTMVRSHRPVMDLIQNSGKMEYAEYFDGLHKPVDFDILQTTVTSYTDEAKADIIGSALRLIEATQNDPANTAFLTGLGEDDIKNLHASLSDANYLMPEDAPSTREAPISEQALRGTKEQQSAIIDNLALIVLNVDVPESVEQSNGPMISVALAKQVIENAPTEDIIEVSSYDPIAANPFNSDLMAEDAANLLDLYDASTKLVATIDPENLDNVLISEKELAKFAAVLENYHENNYDAVLKGKKYSFQAPGLSADSGKAIAALANSMDEIYTYTPELENDIVHADEGGLSTESSVDFSSDDLDALFPDMSEEDRDVLKGNSKDSKTDQSHSEYMEKLHRDITAITDDLIPDEKRKSVPHHLFDDMETKSINFIYRGYDQTLHQIAGSDISTLSRGVDRGTHATYSEAKNAGGKSKVNLVDDNYAMTLRRHRELGGNDRVIKVDAKTGYFEKSGYKAPTSENAHEYVKTFVNENMTEDGKPNVTFRSMLREMSARPVAASSENEAIAWKLAAQHMVELDNAEKNLRKEVMENKIGMSYIDLPSDQVKKFTDVVTASGSAKPGRLTIDKEGGVQITHPDGPSLTGRTETVPEGLAKAKEGVRKFGGHVHCDSLKAANESSSGQGVTIVMVGESVKGVMSKIDESHTKQPDVKQYPDMSLS